MIFFFQAEDGIRDLTVTGVQTCALPICLCGRLLGGAGRGGRFLGRGGGFRRGRSARGRVLRSREHRAGKRDGGGGGDEKEWAGGAGRRQGHGVGRGAGRGRREDLGGGGPFKKKKKKSFIDIIVMKRSLYKSIYTEYVTLVPSRLNKLFY